MAQDLQKIYESYFVWPPLPNCVRYFLLLLLFLFLCLLPLYSPSLSSHPFTLLLFSSSPFFFPFHQTTGPLRLLYPPFPYPWTSPSVRGSGYDNLKSPGVALLRSSTPRGSRFPLFNHPWDTKDWSLSGDNLGNLSSVLVFLDGART